MAKILIIEDQNFISCNHGIALATRYICVSAPDGKVGLNLFVSEKPDVVLSTVRLPDLSVLDVVRHIKSKSKTPVIVLSDAPGSDEDTLIQAQVSGADGSHQASVTTDELLSSVNICLQIASAPV